MKRAGTRNICFFYLALHEKEGFFSFDFFFDLLIKRFSERGYKHLQSTKPKEKLLKITTARFFCVQCHFYIILDANKFFVTDLSLGIVLEISYLAILLEIAGDRRSTSRSAVL